MSFCACNVCRPDHLVCTVHVTVYNKERICCPLLLTRFYLVSQANCQIQAYQRQIIVVGTLLGQFSVLSIVCDMSIK